MRYGAPIRKKVLTTNKGRVESGRVINVDLLMFATHGNGYPVRNEDR